MANIIMVGCDLHDKNMLLKLAVGRGQPWKRMVKNTMWGRREMVAYLEKLSRQHGNAKVVFAYEASQQGFGLHDDLEDAGIECHVLAPSRMPRSPKAERDKTDEKDAGRVLETLRAHYLAGNALPGIWIPDPQTRDERDLMRCRQDVAEKIALIKAQVVSLLKRNRVEKPENMDEQKSWTKGHRAWLGRLTDGSSEYGRMPMGFRNVLGSLLRQLETLEKEEEVVDQAVQELSETARYAEPVKALREGFKGVGTLTAMVYLTEMGDLRRFENRKQVGSYLGLVPSAWESGEQGDRKGGITHQGPARVSRILCQSTWSRLRYDPPTAAKYEKIKIKNPKAKKKAVVAMMRQLAVKMWHVGLEAQRRAGSYGGPPPRIA